MNDAKKSAESGPLKNPDWTDEENLQWDSWVNGGVKTAEQATTDIEKARAERAQTYNPEPETESPAHGSDEDAYISPAPAQPGESDDRISRQHLEELARSGFGDPEKRAELERREAEGDARLEAAREEEMRQGRAFHQRLSEVSPPPEDIQK